MRKQWKNLLVVLCAALMIMGVWRNVPAPQVQAAYQPIPPETLAGEIDEFFAAGARGYLVWQYSGYRGEELGNDQYSFFANEGQGPEICKVLKEKSLIPDKFVGVNMWDSPDPKHAGKLDKNFAFLEGCGVTVVRIFAYAGSAPDEINPENVTRVLNVAGNHGIKLIVAIGDYSNGGGGVPKGANGGWYALGYKAAYQRNATNLYNAIKGHPALFGMELANEAHCGGNAAALPDYTNWANTMAGLLPDVTLGIGQAASDNVVGRCDNPVAPEGQQSEFYTTNLKMEMVSGHYYDAAQKATALIGVSQTPPGAFYYVGEAGWGGAVSQNEYYLYPINSLQAPPNQLPDPIAIQQDLVKQGYEISCSVPQLTVKADLGGAIDRFLQLNPNPNIPLSLEPNLLVDYTDATYPLWRNPLSNNLYSSLETYYGYRDGTAADELQLKLNSAPLYSLMTTEQQCQQQVRILETIEKMCSKLDDPEECALYQSIPNTPFTTHPNSLLAEWRGSGLSCRSLLQSSSGPQAPLTPDQQAQRLRLKNGLDNTPLYLSKAYRLAFLVVVSELKEETPGGFFSFMRKPGSATPRDEVRVIAFKIPDIGTNRDPESDIYYLDPLQLTRDSLSTQELKQYRIKQATELRGQQLAAITDPEKLPKDITAAPIVCNDTTCSDLKDPLTIALAQMVNRTNNACAVNEADLKYEVSSEIKDAVKIESSEGTEFKENKFDLVGNLFQGDVPDVGAKADPNKRTFNFMSTVRITGNNSGGDSDQTTKIRAFLVYPVGAELRTVENTLASLIMNEQEYRKFTDASETVDYFTMADQKTEFENNKASFGFNDPECKPQEGGSPEDGTCRKDVLAEVNIAEKDKNIAPRIKGARLGLITRNIQRSLAGLSTKAHDFVSSCTTTEEFLLGNCRRGNEDDGSVKSNARYCIKWETKDLTPADIDQIKQSTRQYMQSFAYTYDQPGSPANPAKSDAERQRYEELRQQRHVDANGQVIPFDKMNSIERFYNGGRALLWTKAEQCEGKVCYDYIMDRCAAAGYNPALCVAMDISESGGSNHIRFTGSYDFGCLTAEPNNIPSGLNCLFTGFFDRLEVAGKDYNTMFLEYAEHGFSSPSYRRIEELYLNMAGQVGYNEGACK